MRYLSAISLLLLLASCEKEPPIICVPPLDEGLDQYGFIIKDSSGQNLLTTTAANRLDTATIKVVQPCTDRPGRKILDPNGILSFDIGIRPSNGKRCHTAIVQWRNNDIDTFTYVVQAIPSTCALDGLHFYIDSSSLLLNGRKPERDTITSLSMGYRAVYTIIK